MILNIISNNYRTIEKKSKGKALGIAYGGMNFLIIVLPYGMGYIIDNHQPNEYKTLLILFAIIKIIFLFLYFLGYICEEKIGKEKDEEIRINSSIQTNEY